MTPSDIFNWVTQQGPSIVLLVFVLYSGARKEPLWMFHSSHKAVVKAMEEQIATLEAQRDAALARAETWQRMVQARAETKDDAG